MALMMLASYPFMRLALLTPILALGLPLCAEICNPTDLQGTYGFRLPGETNISGEPKPTTNIGRILLAEDGRITGYSTAMFAGYLLGNPVTGPTRLIGIARLPGSCKTILARSNISAASLPVAEGACISARQTLGAPSTAPWRELRLNVSSPICGMNTRLHCLAAPRR
jgi:hypothetical protein